MYLAIHPCVRSHTARRVRDRRSCSCWQIRQCSSRVALARLLACHLLEQRGTNEMTQLLNIFAPESTPARAIVDLSTFVLSVTAVIFVVVAGLMVYAIVTFRAT